VGEVVLGGGGVFAVLALSLMSVSMDHWLEKERERKLTFVSSAPSERAQRTLNSACGLVQVGLGS
jgi:hypothetical protein